MSEKLLKLPVFGCPNWFKHKWQDGFWTIGDCGRKQAEGECGYRCYHCGEIKYYKYIKGKKTEFSIKQLRDDAIKHISKLYPKEQPHE